MALTAFTSTIAAATFNANFDDKLAAIAAVNAGGVKAHTVSLYCESLTTEQSVQFVAGDDYEVVAFVARVTDNGIRELSASLSVVGGDADYLNQETISILMATSNGTDDSRSLATPLYEPSRRTTLKKGVRYKIAALNEDAGTILGPVHVMAYLLGRRRDA